MQENCAFCLLPTHEPEKVIIFNDDAYVIEPRGWEDGEHLLVIPRLHLEDPSKAFEIEGFSRLIGATMRLLKRRIGCSATNVSLNDGIAAGQTMAHPHAWVVARWSDKKLSGMGLATILRRLDEN